MRLYLDNCCFNRPFDDQTSVVIRLETDAKLYVQDMIKSGELDLVWSFILDYENSANPFDEVRNRIGEWRKLACADIGLSQEVDVKARELMEMGLRQKDAAHVACAVIAGAEYFLTTDKKILNKNIEHITLINPIDFIRRYTDAE